MIPTLTIRQEASQVSNHVKNKNMYPGAVKGGQSVGTCHTDNGAISKALYLTLYPTGSLKVSSFSQIKTVHFNSIAPSYLKS